jgi:hypothetical protein
VASMNEQLTLWEVDTPDAPSEPKPDDEPDPESEPEPGL